MTGKRVFDLCCAVSGCLILFPLLLIVAVLVKTDSPGPVFFRQTRVGRFGRPFRIFKFRTMRDDAERRGALVSTADDPRITRLGVFLRNYKIDELPQLLNVIRGEMSLVGPRPEVPKYVEVYPQDYQEILRVRPGITDFASLEFRDENELLRGVDNPEQVYLECVLPQKLVLNKRYIREQSFLTDLKLILRTVVKIFL